MNFWESNSESFGWICALLSVLSAYYFGCAPTEKRWWVALISTWIMLVIVYSILVYTA